MKMFFKEHFGLRALVKNLQQRLNEKDSYIKKWELGHIPEGRIIDWTDEDQKTFKVFLESPAGAKFRTHVEFSAQAIARNACISGESQDLSNASAYNRMVNLIYNLSNFARATNEKDFIKNSVGLSEWAARNKPEARDDMYSMPKNWKPEPYWGR